MENKEATHTPTPRYRFRDDEIPETYHVVLNYDQTGGILAHLPPHKGQPGRKLHLLDLDVIHQAMVNAKLCDELLTVAKHEKKRADELLSVLRDVVAYFKGTVDAEMDPMIAAREAVFRGSQFSKTSATIAKAEGPEAR